MKLLICIFLFVSHSTSVLSQPTHEENLPTNFKLDVLIKTTNDKAATFPNTVNINFLRVELEDMFKKQGESSYMHSWHNKEISLVENQIADISLIHWKSGYWSLRLSILEENFTHPNSYFIELCNNAQYFKDLEDMKFLLEKINLSCLGHHKDQEGNLKDIYSATLESI